MTRRVNDQEGAGCPFLIVLALALVLYYKERMTQELKDCLIRQVHTMRCMISYTHRLNKFTDHKTIYGIVLEYGVGKICLVEEWPGIERGLYKACYFNAYRLMRSNPSRFIYTEGFGCRPSFVTVAGTHAWVLDKKNNYQVIDPTWRETENAAYIGVPFSSKFVTAQRKKRRDMFSILDAYWDDFPIFRLPPEAWLYPEADQIPRDFLVPQDMPDLTVAFAQMSV